MSVPHLTKVSLCGRCLLVRVPGQDVFQHLPSSSTSLLATSSKVTMSNISCKALWGMCGCLSLTSVTLKKMTIFEMNENSQSAENHLYLYLKCPLPSTSVDTLLKSQTIFSLTSRCIYVFIYDHPNIFINILILHWSKFELYNYYFIFSHLIYCIICEAFLIMMFSRLRFLLWTFLWQFSHAVKRTVKKAVGQIGQSLVDLFFIQTSSSISAKS